MSYIANKKRAQKNRKKLKKVNKKDRFRLTVFRSSRNISAQIIDEKNMKTLVSATSIKKASSKQKKANMSAEVASILAKKALDKKITKVYFDRGRYRYHGRIKFFAEALRKGGLNF
jgi:large subunit ribosomal protein L18|tara:strand:- start:51 stop:398 length:348 start_codon:yes stop_codon:yes gene_type:complete